MVDGYRYRPCYYRRDFDVSLRPSVSSGLAMRVCIWSGCPVLVISGYCEDHQRTRSRLKDARRESRVPLIHTNRWTQYSKRRLAQHPWCVGYPLGVHGAHRVLAECTDHIKSARDYPDLATDSDNHQSLCLDCNRRKNIAEEGGLGRG